MEREKTRFSPRRALFPAGYYAANAVYQGYMSLFYTNLGFDSVRLGSISAATAAAALAAQPAWGLLGDRARSRRRLLCILCLLSAVALPLALVRPAFGAQILAAMLFYAFFCALLPLGDAILLEAEVGAFGGYRLAGGASFAISGAVFGAVMGRTGPAGAVWVTSGILLLAALAALLLPDAPGKQRRERITMARLLRDRDLVRMLLFVLPVQMTMGFFYTFYAPHFKALGGTEAQLGLGYLLSAVCEAPYLLLSGRIYRRFGAARPMCVSALLLAARWLMLGFAPSAGVALASQALHGGGFIVLSVSMAYWISDHASPELRASGQGLLNLVTFGAARVLGNLGGGLLARAVGSGGAFLAGAGVCAASLCAFAAWAFRRKE